MGCRFFAPNLDFFWRLINNLRRVSWGEFPCGGIPRDPHERGIKHAGSSDGRKEGREGGRKEGKKKERKEGRKEGGRKEGRKESRQADTKAG